MKVRIGLMGFGRVGRNIFRILAKRDDLEVVAVCDIAEPKSLEYLLKYDSVLGRFPEAVSLSDSTLQVGDKKVAMLSGKNLADTAWRDHKVDVVIEATGRIRNRADADKHLQMGAKRVVLCVPTSEKPDIEVVMGINHKDLKASHKVISHASITAHCALPVVKIIEESFGIERLFFTAVHAYSNDQRLADMPNDDLRRSRAATENIVPTVSSAEQIIARMVPSLQGKVSGMALKVPVANGSVVDMVSFTKKPVSVQAVNEAVHSAAAGPYQNILEYMADPIVSSDVKLSPYSCTYDSLATMAMGQNAVKTLSWYDNGWGYAHRAVELVEYIAKLEGGLS